MTIQKNRIMPMLATLCVAGFIGCSIVIFKPLYISLLCLALVLPVLASQPKYLACIFLGIIFTFASGTYGALSPEKLLDIYGKGTGVLHFSLVNILLFFIFIVTLIIKMADKSRHAELFSLGKYFMAFGVLFSGYAIWGIVDGIPFSQIMSYRGCINVINMILVVLVLAAIFREKKDIMVLKNFFLTNMLIRGIWGFCRFLFLGGDPQNYYANFERLDMKITFWDIGDCMISAFAVFYCAWSLLSNKELLTEKYRALYISIIFIGLFNIIFSYRRTAWIGLLLVIIWSISLLPAKKRFSFSALAITLITPILLLVSKGRFKTSQGGGASAIFSDIASNGQFSIMQGRFVELYLAFKTIKNDILFGLGPWGHYQKISSSAWGLGSNFTHSSIVHMWLKMGLVGLIVFLAIFCSYIRMWVSERKDISSDMRGFGEAAVAGFVFLIPDILFGTPIIEFRHMALIGFCIGVPYIVVNAKNHVAQM